MRITIRDIAKETGLSINTVSKVLNKKPYYSKSAELKVTKAVGELGYIANANAAALKSGLSKVIAIVFDDMTNPYYFFMTSRIAYQMKINGYDTIMYSNYGRTSFLEKTLLTQILSRGVDGIVSFIEAVGDAKEILKKSKIPFLIVGRNGTEDGFNSIYSDDLQGGVLAVNHLVGLGHRRIVYLGADDAMHLSVRRGEGYRQALREHGIEANPKLMVSYKNFDPTLKDNMKFFVDFLIHTDATAVFAFNDNFAFRLMERLEEVGKSVPGDYALVGYDNIQQYLRLPKWLTTVDANQKKMADTAIAFMIAAMQGRKYDVRSGYGLDELTLVKGAST